MTLSCCYNIGDRVIATAFTDHKGVFHHDSVPLIVKEIQAITGSHPHFRVYAEDTTGMLRVEAVQSSFRRTP